MQTIFNFIKNNAKILILSAAGLAVVAVGATGVYIATNQPAPVDTTTTEEVTMSDTTQAIQDALTSALQEIESAKQQALTQIQQATTVPTTAQKMMTTESTEPPEPKIIPLNIKSDLDGGATLKFTKMVVDYDSGEIVLYFTATAQKALKLDPHIITLNTSGRQYKVRKGDLPSLKVKDDLYSAECYIGFLSNPTEGTPFTITFAVEGYPPSDIEFTIN